MAFLALGLGLVSCEQEKPPAKSAAAAPASIPVQIPKAAEDWVKEAHRVMILNPLDKTPGAKASLALAWTPSALLLQARVEDTTPFETDDELWNGDSVGLFVASSFESDDNFQIVCGPGGTADHPKPRWHVYDKRIGAPPVVAPEVHAVRDSKGYTMTISVPWANLKHIPAAGDVIGVQVYVDDAQSLNTVARQAWYPGLGTDGDPSQMVHVQLASQADPPEIATASTHPKGLHEAAVEVLGVPEAAGHPIEIWSGDKQVGSGQLAPDGLEGNSSADIVLPPELAGQKNALLMVTVDGKPLPLALKVPDLAGLRLDLAKSQPLVASPSVFDGAVFPKIDFLNNELLEGALGPYTLHPRYFDAGWHEVTTPSAPGRYGALVEYRSADGLSCTRHVTLFKTAHPYFPAKDPYGGTLKLPDAIGLPANVLEQEQWNVNDWIGSTLGRGERNDPNLASMLAALQSIANDPARWHGFNIWRINDSWWAELRRREGTEQEYPHLTHLPDGYDKDQRAWPLILFLHGSGSRGTDLKMVRSEGPLHYINQGHSIPFIVVTPQCPPDEAWDSARLAHLIDKVSAKYRVDPKRVYVTGLSLGGFGTWDLAANYPDKITAIAPVSGGEDPAIAERLKKMPAWVFHGSEDSVVPTRYSLGVVDAMKGFGAPVKLTVYPGLGHGGWNMTYDNPALYSWFLEYSK